MTALDQALAGLLAAVALLVLALVVRGCLSFRARARRAKHWTRVDVSVGYRVNPLSIKPSSSSGVRSKG